MLQTRAGKEPIVQGYASVFYSEADKEGTTFRIYSDLEERIAPTAFDRALSERQDVRALYNHDFSNVVARTKAGSLTLAKDTKGLLYSFEHDPALRASVDVVTGIERGLVDGSSFGFVARTVSWTEQKTDAGWIYIRTIEDLDLYEVSALSAPPAYMGTSVGFRSAAGNGVNLDNEFRSALIAERDAYFAVRSSAKVSIAAAKLRLAK